MKKLLILFLMAIPIAAFSMTLPQLFETAKASNTTFAITGLNLKQASMTYQMNMIQASVPIVNKGEQLSAQITYLSNLQSYQNGLKNYYSDVVNAAFNVKTTSISLEIAKMKLMVATMDYANKLALFQKSLASTLSLKQASVTVANDQNNLKNAKWNYDFSLSDFQEITGLKWQAITFTMPVLSTIPENMATWMKNDLNLKLSILRLQKAQYSLNITPSNSSQYTIEMAKLAVQQAELNRNNVFLSSKNNYLSSIQKLRYDYEKVLNAKASLDISTDNLDFYTNAYNSGLISQSEYINKYKIPYLETQLSYYNSLQTYWNVLVSYVLSMGLKPEVILK